MRRGSGKGGEEGKEGKVEEQVQHSGEEMLEELTAEVGMGWLHRTKMFIEGRRNMMVEELIEVARAALEEVTENSERRLLEVVVDIGLSKMGWKAMIKKKKEVKRVRWMLKLVNTDSTSLGWRGW